ncbi:MAG: response regulator [Archangium sp.]|nr:response regulator [Archangium sp.]
MNRGRYDFPVFPRSTRKARVLAVDDDVANLRLLASYLTHEGYEVATAEDGPAAIARLEAGDIDLLILDVRMDGMDGLEVCRRLRAQPRFERLPIIFLTADRADELRETAGLEAGGDEYLHKPIARKVLALRVRNLLRLANADREQRLMAQVAHAEKLAGIGQVAAGVAHEINNPLSFILSNLGSLRLYFQEVSQVLAAWHRSPEEGRAKELALKLDATLADVGPLIDETAQGGERVRRIVQELKTFSRTDDETLEEVDLSEVVRATLLLTERELTARARLVKDLAAAPLHSASRQKLHQVVLNLIINALQAVEARPLTGGERHVITLTTRTEGGNAVLAVSDTGAGIPEELRRRIFEPFFTTKPVGVGTGLGLAVCAMVVTRLGGHIEVTSAVGEGSTFTLTIPCDAQPTPDEPLPAAVLARA